MYLLKRLFLTVLAVLAIAIAPNAKSDEQVDFKRQVLPILVSHCFRCHGPDKQEGGLRLDLKQSALRGGDNYAPAIVAGKSQDSPLFQFVSRQEADLKMPPKGPALSSEEIDILRGWIDQGAIWPNEPTVQDPSKLHWAFQPLQLPRVPASLSVEIAEQNPIDRFVGAKLHEHGLRMSAGADRATLIRRLSFGLLGLPPTPEDVAIFIRDPNPAAYEELVDRLLTSPQFGERWARHWLDVVRFAESHGFEMNQARPNAWRYRDYVIRSFNEDKPYDAFVCEQLAGDRLNADDATGFLVGGPWDQVKSPDPVLTAQQRADELHDMISTTGSAFLGLTVGCARCHSHKFDPIPQTDYYALKACLEGVQHGDRELRGSRRSELAADRNAVEKTRAELVALESKPEPIPINARLNVERFSPISATKLRFTIRATNQSQPCLDELEIWTAEPTPRNVALAAAGAKATASSTLPNHELHRLEHIHDGRYGNSRSWISNEVGSGWIEIEFERAETIDRVLWGRDREQKYTDRLPTEYIIEVHSGDEWKPVASSKDHVELPERLARRKELEQQIAAFYSGPQSYAGKFVQPETTVRFHRGDPMQPREPVPPGSLTSFGERFQLAASAPEPERRLALANWIIDSRNPLTARVIVNRIWQQYFGEGIVPTPSDFGLNGGRPSHPELLDWLATELVQNGWNLKHIHRLIVLSATYRQASAVRPEALSKDSSSRLLWRFPPKRLEAESLRDSILAVCGNLDVRSGGPGFDLFEPNNNYVKVYQPKQIFGPPEWRRMIYQAKPRMQLDDTFGAFDCPDSGQIAPKRTRSTTALQALNLLNSPFIVQQAELFAERLRRDAGDDIESQIRRAFELAFQRSPHADELSAAKTVVRESSLIVLCRALLNANEFLHVY
jgi:mono/diheme cytochrome c family protein